MKKLRLFAAILALAFAATTIASCAMAPKCGGFGSSKTYKKK